MTPSTAGGTIRIAVVGHTNAGKTSLMRTLLRDSAFGEVSISPATTRHVEAARLDLGEGLVIEFDDTPGFEDSVGLVDFVHRYVPDPRVEGPERLARFLGSDAAQREFRQEAKAIAQLLAADLALYVLDAGAPVTGRMVDEFSLLLWSGRPCLVVLNFVAEAAHADAWREALGRSGLHNVAAFDTVVFNPDDEARLLRQVATLLPGAAPHLDALAARRAAERAEQLDAAAGLIADALIECAALREGGDGAADRIADRARERERQLDRELLTLFRFTERDYRPEHLPIEGADWTLDLFDGAVLGRLGLSLGSSAAKGAAAGATVDLVTGLTSLGAASLIGGAIGAGVDGLRRVQRYLSEGGAGTSPRQVSVPSLTFLARRSCRLAQDLARRGHAAVIPLAGQEWRLDVPLVGEGRIQTLLAECRYRPGWLGAPEREAERTVRRELIELVAANLRGEQPA